ncbi:MAG: ABC transporter ATP-binding protein [bacterium]
MIKVEKLSKSYDAQAALKEISFEVPRGQICGYLGPNGAGKSTTVKILTGTLRSSSGRALVAGFDVGVEALEVKRRIGYVPEVAALYDTLSAQEFLTLIGTLHGLTPAEISHRCAEMLALFEIAEAAQHKLGALSKGMRQKVVLISAFLHDPEVILLDEPLSGLDANATLVVKDIIQAQAQRGKTILYCSHLLDVVERLCERVIILNKGEIVADCSTRELIAMSSRGTLEEVFRELTHSADRHESAAQFDRAFHNAPAGGAESADEISGPSPKKSKPKKRGKKCRQKV